MTTAEKGVEPGMKVYVSVWLGMLVIVAIEATLVYLRVSTGMLVASLLVLAFFEAAVALRYFMHLKYEVPLLFWTFRGMALLGIYAIVLFGCAFWLASNRKLDRRWFLRTAAWSLPVPWIAGALGWIVSEIGRGPWVIDGVLPVTQTHASRPDVIIGVFACTGIAVLFVAGATLLIRLVRLGPEGLKFWPVDSGHAGRY